MNDINCNYLVATGLLVIKKYFNIPILVIGYFVRCRTIVCIHIYVNYLNNILMKLVLMKNSVKKSQMLKITQNADKTFRFPKYNYPGENSTLYLNNTQDVDLQTH